MDICECSTWRERSESVTATVAPAAIVKSNMGDRFFGEESLENLLEQLPQKDGSSSCKLSGWSPSQTFS